MKEQGKLLLSTSELVRPTHFTVAVIRENGLEVVFDGLLGDTTADLFAKVFCTQIIRSGESAYIIVNEVDLKWFNENLSAD